nr:EF-hand domain-containing protein [Allomuricauda sp.]
MKKDTFRTVLVLGVILMFSSTSIFAQQGGQGDRKGPPSFSKLLEKMDENEDGKLSEAEVKGPLKNDFAKIDLNEDGYIDEEEFNKAPKPKKRERSK